MGCRWIPPNLVKFDLTFKSVESFSYFQLIVYKRNLYVFVTYMTNALFNLQFPHHFYMDVYTIKS